MDFIVTIHMPTQLLYSPGNFFLGALAKRLKRQAADIEVAALPGSSPVHGMEELSRSSFNHCISHRLRGGRLFGGRRSSLLPEYFPFITLINLS